MTADLDRKIVTVRYNLLNLPDTIQYYDGSMTVNHYLADGTRLSSVHHTVLDGVVVPVGSVCNVDTIANVTTSGSAYCQNIEYEMQADGHIKNNSTGTGFQPYLYSGKELVKMHGYDCYDYGARHSQTTLGRFTTIDPLAEKYYPTSPYVLCGGNTVMYIDPDGMEPTPAEAVRIAAHVYGDKIDDILIGGWKVSQEDYGLVYNDETGLNSALYERTVDGVTEYVYATAGTVDFNDWVENVKQPFGLSEQYEHSAYNAGELSDKLKDKELTYVGHSLGGGEAAMNSFVTYGKGPGRRAFTFNAAGVGHITKLKDGGWNVFVGSENNIDAYILITNPLNALQNSKILMPNVNGKRHYLMPKDWSSTYNGHSIDNILKNFE